MTATWGDLFGRADAYDVTEADVRRALAERRDARAGGDGSPVDPAGEDDGTATDG